MKRIAFYGKGGIGKSTLATGVSLHLARTGRRVLHVGCDPKSDSSLVLLKDPSQQKFRTVISELGQRDLEDMEASDIIMPGIAGIDCIESGGPEAGVGCGGRAVSRAFEVYDELGVVDERRYDVSVFDVLGDVVCGGFAAPMRRATGALIVIVLSEEMMANYAANNIARACVRYSEAVRLAGFVVNVRSNHADLGPIERFAEAIGTKIISVIPRDPVVGIAELNRKSVLDHAPTSPVSHSLRYLAETLMAMDRDALPVPNPLSGDDVREVMRGEGAEDGDALELPAGFPRNYGLDSF